MTSTQPPTRTLVWTACLCLGGALLGAVFAAYSTSDYTAHLDRQVHAVHCSFIPGASVDGAESNPCKVALFSPYSALFRQTYWGGIPISLAALGCFSFFAALGLYLLLARERAPRGVVVLLGVTGFVPLAASIVMFGISLTQLHAFCKVCVGIYASSALVAAAAFLSWRLRHQSGRTMFVLAGGVVALGFASLLPAVVYASSMPDYKPYLKTCGTLAHETEPHNALVKITTSSPKRQTLLFEDPLCPTCKAFHERLCRRGNLRAARRHAGDVSARQRLQLDARPRLHPGACVSPRPSSAEKTRRARSSSGRTTSRKTCGRSASKAARALKDRDRRAVGRGRRRVRRRASRPTAS